MTVVGTFDAIHGGKDVQYTYRKIKTHPSMQKPPYKRNAPPSERPKAAWNLSHVMARKKLKNQFIAVTKPMPVCFAGGISSYKRSQGHRL